MKGPPFDQHSHPMPRGNPNLGVEITVPDGTGEDVNKDLKHLLEDAGSDGSDNELHHSKPQTSSLT